MLSLSLMGFLIKVWIYCFIFQTAFIGQKKRLEALIYCANEIFIHLDENLKSTPQTISDKATPIEEATEKHERVNI